MNRSQKTIDTEDRIYPPFFDRTRLSIERGEGIYVWDEDGRRYIDLTAGWGVTCIGHSNPVIVQALTEQGSRIIQNPNSSATYSPVRAQLLQLMREILPQGLTRVFFSNSGAESNDAVIKLARKASRKLNVISTLGSFHGRTISTASATGQPVHRDKFQPLMPNYRFVPYNDVDAIAREITDDIAAVILEPIQGEGGVNVPDPAYLGGVADLCRRHGAYLIVDEVQTGFCRTGPLFAVESSGIHPDFLTMAKGIAGGFPFGAFAMTEEVTARLEKGDHGGTYSGNPLGCAVSLAVIRHLIDNRIGEHVRVMGEFVQAALRRWQREYPDKVVDVRGRGLLIAMELATGDLGTAVNKRCLENGMILNVKHGTVVRIFPALTITRSEMEEALGILKEALDYTVRR